MRSGQVGAAPVIRLWWTVPLGLALLSAVVFVAVVVPALANRPGVPSQLVVQQSQSQSQPPAKPSPTSRHSPTPRPSRTSASPAPPPSTTVVPAEQPVVRESESERGDDRGTASGEPRDR